MDLNSALREIISGDLLRMEVLGAVNALALPDCWIGAGFVRDAVWDHLHGKPRTRLFGDVDVIWFDRVSGAEVDARHEVDLRTRIPDLRWSVKNQARMHVRNRDAPYTSVADAMRAWPETATAVAVRLDAAGRIEINAPLGLTDLFALRLVPTPSFVRDKRRVFDARVREKRWMQRYPLLWIDAEGISTDTEIL